MLLFQQALSIKRIPADEFPHQAGGGDFVIHLGFHNEVQDFYAVADLVKPAILGLDGGKQGVNMLLEHRQLVEGGAVENHIRVFLEGENPPLLSLPDGLPHGQGPLDGGAPGFVIPDDPPEQPQVAGGNPVVIVHIEG